MAGHPIADSHHGVRRSVGLGVGPRDEQAAEYSTDGLLYYWGVYGTFPGGFWGIHQFSVDPQGNLYVAETYGGRTQEFRVTAAVPEQSTAELVKMLRSESV